MTNKAKIKYVLCPGWVTSKWDRDLHFINSQQLIKLYNVNPEECVTFQNNIVFARFVRNNNLIFLRPRMDGEYNVNKNI